VINWSTSDIAGIEFGDSHIAAARLRGKEDSLVLTHAGVVEYDPSASPKAIAGVVRTLWKQCRMPTNTVCASLRSGSLMMRYFSMPALSAPELKSALLLQAEEALQLPGDQLALEWHVHGHAPEEAPGGPVSGVLAAAPIRDVERELEVFQEAGLDPVILDVRALAVANLHRVLRSEESRAVMCLINLSPHSADVVVQRGTGEIYPHTLYCRASTWAESPAFLGENVRDVLRYAEYKLGWESLQRIVLTGQIPRESDFARVLGEGLRATVEVWNPLENISRKAGAVSGLLERDPLVAQLLTPVLGLALRRN
jgi:Tfp pilus assembly PilM family ATPase